MSEPNPQLPQLLKEALGDAYTIEGEIGRGGMGVVYRARDARLNRRVAVKVLPPELAFSREIRERFTREAQTAARLAHPHIVPIHDVGEGEGIVYFVMGLIEGESLAGRLRRRGRLPAEEARRIMKETADALSAAHALSVIHRDIKPDNILLEGSRGRVMVTDFGIAKAMSATTGHTLTSVGMAIGTPSFMSPEQAAGEREIDGRSDIYSLGIVTYQMLAGELPFTAPSVAGILMKHITEPAPLLHERYPDIGEDLSLTVARCLEKDPANRWPSADTLRRALESRSVAGYRPTGLGWRAESGHRATSSRTAPSRSPAARPGQPLADRPTRQTPGRASDDRTFTRGRERAPTSRPRPWEDRSDQGSSRRGVLAPRPQRPAKPLPARRQDVQDAALPETGEPLVVRRARAEFVRSGAIMGGLLMVNVATGSGPWFLFVWAVLSFGIFRRYSELWQAGYSWRDVLNRPSAPDAVTSGGAPRRAIAAKALVRPAPEEFGRYHQTIRNVWSDRQAILSLWDKLSDADRMLLPDMVQTIDSLYERSQQLGHMLQALDEGLPQEDPADDAQRLTDLRARPESPERDRQLELLERKQRVHADLIQRRTECLDHLESCTLMMQTLRLDTLRIKDRGIGAVMSGLNEATQQARAMSRDVENALGAAAEVRDL